jgi:putative FmdB family regulatory protein
MPVYEFVCRGCGKKFEKVSSIKEFTERTKCECGKIADLTPSHTGAPILVGRGFHANDYGAPTKA